MTGAMRTAIWLDAGQVGLARAVALRAGLDVVAAGGPEAGRSGMLASGLGGARPLGDLRSALAEAGAGLDVRCVLLLSRQGLGAPEVPGLLAAHGRRVVVASIEPVPGGLDGLTDGVWLGRSGTQRAIDAARPLARLRSAAAMHNARDMLAAFGAIRSVWVRCVGRASEGSLGARIVDGLHVLQDLLGDPEGVCAVSAGEPGGATEANELGALGGEVCATLTYANGCVGVALASDRSDRWEREVVLLGEGGIVRLNDTSFSWHLADGSRRDEWRSNRTGGGRAADEAAAPLFTDSAEAAGADAIAASVARLLDPHAGVEPHVDAEVVLATAHAALLSARTRGTESPETIRRMMSRE